jgi:hypothetical protein
MKQNWKNSRTPVIHNAALEAKGVTYYAQLRISGKVGITLIPAEMPFITNINTSSQS